MASSRCSCQVHPNDDHFWLPSLVEDWLNFVFPSSAKKTQLEYSICFRFFRFERFWKFMVLYSLRIVSQTNLNLFLLSPSQQTRGSSQFRGHQWSVDSLFEQEMKSSNIFLFSSKTQARMRTSWTRRTHTTITNHQPFNPNVQEHC